MEPTEEHKAAPLGHLLDRGQVRWATQGDCVLGRRLGTQVTLEETETAVEEAVADHLIEDHRTKVLGTKDRERDSHWETTRK